MQDDGRLDRRQFTRRLVGGTSVAVGLAAVASEAAEVPPAPKLPEDPAPTKATDGTAVPPPEVLLLSYLVQTYPSDHFDEAAIQGIFRDIRGDVARGRILSQFPLLNSDEPSFVFAARRSTDGIPQDG